VRAARLVTKTALAAALLAAAAATGPAAAPGEAAASPSGAPAGSPGLALSRPGGGRLALRTPAARAGRRPVTRRRSLAAVRAYWTARRMAGARPAEQLTLAAGVRFTRPAALDSYLHRLAPGRGTPQVETGAPWTRGGAVARTTGKVFFSLGASDYVCSGSAVDSPDRSTVLTAGHCVVDPESGTTATNWVFVPAYANGTAPYGIFPATHLATTTGWRISENFDVDVAFANVGANGAGVGLVAAVGGQPIAFGVARGQRTTAFGYPATPPWTGEQLVYCSGVVVQDTTPVPSTDQGLTCTMTPGSSGGPWFTGFDQRTGKGTLTSVTSFSYSNLGGVLWGPYLGSVAQALYASVASTTSA
jgi:V8-like Glu-specific endopeptidase